MAWASAQSGVIRQRPNFLNTLPGSPIALLALSIAVYLIVGCILEGPRAILLLAPIMFPIARKLGIDDIHCSMVVVVAMNIGLMTSPIGVRFYFACRIVDVSPDAVMGAIWPHLLAPLAGLVVVAGVPWISTVAL